jgi:hypothetical protein
MSRLLLVLGSAVLAAVGCASQKDLLKDKEPEAMQVVLDRARYAMNCPSAQGSVLSKEVIQPAIQTVVGGPERAEYTIGVQGCGKRGVYIGICPQGGSGCFATEQREGQVAPSR